MAIGIEQFTEFNSLASDYLSRFSAVGIASAESLANLQLATSKSVVEDSANNAKISTSVKDPQEFFAVRAKIAEAGVEKVLAYSRSVYDIVSKAQAEYTKLAEEAIAAGNQTVAGLVDKFAKSAPAGSEAAVSAMKSTLAATTAAIDTLTKASKQVVSLGDASVKATSHAAGKAVVKAA